MFMLPISPRGSWFVVCSMASSVCAIPANRTIRGPWLRAAENRTLHRSCQIPPKTLELPMQNPFSNKLCLLEKGMCVCVCEGKNAKSKNMPTTRVTQHPQLPGIVCENGNKLCYPAALSTESRKLFHAAQTSHNQAWPPTSYQTPTTLHSASLP